MSAVSCWTTTQVSFRTTERDYFFKNEYSPSGPDPNLQEEDHKTALHKASWNCDHVLMQMLLEAGADARAMDINGCAPIQYLLKVTDVRPMAVPELCFQLLLNHNAARVYPPQFHKVLQSCHDYPRVIEVLVNSYERLKPTRKWMAAIPHDCYKVDHPSRAVPGIIK